MAIQNNTTHGVLTRYEGSYRKGAAGSRIYDQLAGFMKETMEPRGSTITATMLTDLVPRPTTATVDVNADFIPQTIDDAQASITVEMYADGVKSHQRVDLLQFSPLSAALAEKVGVNMMETVDALARRAATEGTLVLFPGSTHTTRATLIPTTSADIWNDTDFDKTAVILEKLESNRYIDGSMIAIMDPFAYRDFVKTSAHFVNAAQYTEWGKKLLMNGEVGTYGIFRIVKNARAKTFWGSGASHASAYSQLLTTAIAPGDKTCVVAANTNLAVGQWMTVGTAQTAGETDANLTNEGVYVTAINSTTISIAGNGPFGGFRYSHPVGTTTTNAYAVHPVIFGGPNSLAKAVSKELGEYGELVKPFQTGNAKQWTNWSWKWFGGYGRLSDAWIARLETAATGC